MSKLIPLTVKRNDPRYINLSHKNKKLIPNRQTRFLIWNIPAIITCPYATEHCKHLCYAIKAERVYPTVKPARQANFEMSRQADFTDRMIYTLETEISHNETRGIKTVVRIHESGDFYNKVYTSSWLTIARHFEGRNVVFMAYTKSIKFFVGETIPDNMTVRFSIWDDTKPGDIETAKSLGLPTYSADTADVVNSMVESGKTTKCDCADCANCGKCWDKTINSIHCIIH